MLNRVVQTVTTVPEKEFRNTIHVAGSTEREAPGELHNTHSLYSVSNLLNNNVRCLLSTASNNHSVDAGQVTWPWANDP